MEYVKLGRTDLTVSRLGFGAAPIGGLYAREVSEERAVATVHRALDLGMNFVDTAPAYGWGQSERYVGMALAAYQGSPPIVATKVGRVRDGVDYSYDATMAGVEASLQRLGLDHLPLVHLHAVQRAPSVEHVLSPQNALGALHKLQEEGVVGWIGVGTPTAVVAEYIHSGEIDAVLVANQYDLLDRSAADHILPLAAARDTGVIIGGAYGTGILATGPVCDAKYRYRPAPPHVLRRVRRLEGVCEEHGVSLKAAALQFCLRHPAVHSVIPGMSSVEHVEETVAAMDEQIPQNVWEVIETI
jgi:D-threo-aldose 1-dehydrogenase